MSRLKPIFLCADSSLLFWREGKELFLERVRREMAQASPKAAYIGASNGDQPEYYDIFAMAMESVCINEHRMISSRVSDEEKAFLDQSDLILLAGGDVVRGWNAFEENGLDELIREKYVAGVVLIGVSAGAVQLGLCGWAEGEPAAHHLVDTFSLIPFILSAHEEKEEWANLKEAMRAAGPEAHGIGIPSGGGVIYHPDHCLEPIRRPLYEFSLTERELSCNLLFPSDPEDEVIIASQVH